MLIDCKRFESGCTPSVKYVGDSCRGCGFADDCDIETAFDFMGRLIEPKRKLVTQYWEDGNVHTYISPRCTCGCNCAHRVYDGKEIYGICNACGSAIYSVKEEFIEESLAEGVWK